VTFYLSGKLKPKKLCRFLTIRSTLLENGKFFVFVYPNYKMLQCLNVGQKDVVFMRKFLDTTTNMVATHAQALKVVRRFSLFFIICSV